MKGLQRHWCGAVAKLKMIEGQGMDGISDDAIVALDLPGVNGGRMPDLANHAIRQHPVRPLP